MSKKTKIDYKSQKFTVMGQSNFTFTEAIRLWKTAFPTYEDFKKEVIKHPRLEEFGIFVEELWDDVQKFTVQDALSIQNTEIRRTYFHCIGVVELFKQLDPQLRDRKVIKKKRVKWDDNNDAVEYEFEDVYELYEIEGTKLFEKNRWGQDANPVYAVRCWCTTTNREYWIYVNLEAATGQRWWGDADKRKYDAIRAIAWTVRIDVEKPERIYRQGDIIVAKMGPKSRLGATYHLNAKQYLELMYSET
jgi:hypothetical protein